MKDLTKRQEEIFGYICDCIEEKMCPPTIREVAEYFSISVKGSYDHIKAIEKKNYIRCNQNRSRSIEILKKREKSKKAEMISVPLLGNVAAGKPLFAEENYEGVVEVPGHFLRAGKHFAVNIKGDSMIEAGILDGDIAIIRQQSIAENGEIVVAMLDDAFTLKRFYREKNRIKLQPENSEYQPIYITDVKILGKLAFIFRKYE